MKTKYLLALDSGTSSCRTIAFDLEGRIQHVVQKEFPLYYPEPGWVEQDPLEIANYQRATLEGVMKELGDRAGGVVGAGITNQRETVVLWDRRTGEPLHRAIVWQDRRTADFMAELAEDQTLVDLIRARTGLVLDPYFSGSKLKWLLDHVDGARAAAADGHLAFGTIDCWLLWHLTGGRQHATDASNAARTMLFDIHRQCWDESLLELFDIPESVLPEVVDCSGDFGAVDGMDAVHIRGMIGDQQSALFGQGCVTPGDAKTTYGTGCFLLMNTGSDVVQSSTGLLSTVAWRLNGEVTAALEGSVFMGGAAIQWLRDGLGIIDSAPEVNPLAASVDDTGGVVMVPAFAGLGAPHWDAWSRGAVFGMTRGTTAAHIARATLEGISLRIVDVLGAMEKDSSVRLHELRVDGGAAASDLLMQIQANVLGTSVMRPCMLETTALGAAAMAGISAGVYGGVEEVGACWHLDQQFDPQIGDEDRDAIRSRWNHAIECVKGWAQRDDDAS